MDGAVLGTRSLDDVVVDAVRIGGDTDTNAAIAGWLLGARDGQAGIPSQGGRRVMMMCFT